MNSNASFKMKKHFVIFIALMLGWAMPATAATPPGLEDMLKTAVAKGDEAAFDTMVAMALETWPSSRVDILTVASGIQANWLSASYRQEVASAEQAAIEAEKKSRARGIIWYLDPSLWNVTAQLGASTSTGDTDEQSIAFGLAMSREFDKWEHDINLDFDFARSRSTTTRRRLQARLNTLYKAWEGIYVANYLEVDFNRFSGFDYRVLDSLGLGTQLLKSDRQSLRLEGGPGVRFNKFEDTGETSTEFLGRVSSTYELKLTDNIDFKDQASAIFGTGSFTFDNRASLSAQINTSLAARLSFQVQYDSDAPVASAPWDTITRATLVYKF
jgi:putative salt-induced outer membrane protein